MQNSARRPPTLGPSPRTWAIGPPVGSCETTSTIAIIITQTESWYSFYHPTEGRRLSMSTCILPCKICHVTFYWYIIHYFQLSLLQVCVFSNVLFCIVLCCRYVPAVWSALIQVCRVNPSTVQSYLLSTAPSINSAVFNIFISYRGNSCRLQPSYRPNYSHSYGQWQFHVRAGGSVVPQMHPLVFGFAPPVQHDVILLCCVDRNAWESEICLHCKTITDDAWWNFHDWKFHRLMGRGTLIRMGSVEEQKGFEALHPQFWRARRTATA